MARKITDVVGHRIAVYELTTHTVEYKSITVNLSNLANGMYICTLKAGKESISKRIIKQ